MGGPSNTGTGPRPRKQKPLIPVEIRGLHLVARAESQSLPKTAPTLIQRKSINVIGTPAGTPDRATNVDSNQARRRAK